MYIAFEGIVGSGKSTVSQAVLKHLSKTHEVVLTCEPGGDKISNLIRKLVLTSDMEPICEAYLYAASRAQTLNTVVSPALKQNQIVLSDRSFVSSLAFQGFGRNLGVEKILIINSTAINELHPDLIIYLDVVPTVGLKRTFDLDGDKFEREEVSFHQQVRAGYLKLAKMEPFQRKWVNINNQRPIEETVQQTINAIEKRLRM